MSEKLINFVGFIADIKKQIIGLTDDIEYSFLPILLDFSIFSLNIINSIINKFKSYAFLSDYDDKNIIEYLSNPGFEEKIEQISISSSDPYKYFSVSMLGYLNSSKISDDEYLAFLPSNVSYLWNIDFSKIQENFYLINFEDSLKGYIIKVKYFKLLLEKEKIEHFDSFCNKIENNINNNIKNIIIPEKLFSFKVNSLKDYLEIHFNLFKDNKTYILLNNLLHHYEKLGETLITKEAEVINSFMGHNSVIRGKVEDSIIFNNVILLSDTHVQNSIILPGNVIAKGVSIKNSIIGLNKNPMKDITIGPSTKIGHSSYSNLKNILYEKELPEGYTLIGNNILLPGGINIGKNCVVRGKINVLELKKMKNLIDGGTFEQNSTD